LISHRRKSLPSSLAALRRAAAGCEACELYRCGTQTVFGEGPKHATFFFVGEQPGAQEDRTGRPFVGPSGVLLRRALREAEIDERDSYVTNAVKHFRWTLRGTRKLHQSPLIRHIKACHPWLIAELEQVHPEMLIGLGATAAYALLGKRVKLGSVRGQVLSSEQGIKTILTVHPSSLLRIPEPEARHQAYRRFVSDLKLARQAVEKRKAG